MKKIIALAALAALAAVSASASAAGNLFTDGSFEQLTQVGANSWNILSQATLSADENSPGHTGWVVTAAPTLHGPIAGLEVRDGVAGTAHGTGVRFVELDGNENDQISQTLATVAGQKYQITFYFADRPDLTSDQMDVTGGWAATVGDVAGASFDGSVGTHWHKETITFKADSSSTVFKIWATGTSDSLGTSFDDFSAVAIPEPGTLGLFAAGLAMLGLTARRRSKQ